MRPKRNGVYKRIASKCRSIFPSQPRPASTSDAETTSITPTPSSHRTTKLTDTYTDSVSGTLPSGGPIETPIDPDRSLRTCTTQEVAAHICHLLRLLATAINTRDLGHDSFIWEIFHPDYRFQQDEHLPEFSTGLLEHNARMKAMLDNDPKFWCKMEGDVDVRPLRQAGYPADPATEEEVEMLVRLQIVNRGISTVQKVITGWRYEAEGRRWRCLRGVAASDLLSGLPDY